MVADHSRGWEGTFLSNFQLGRKAVGSSRYLCHDGPDSGQAGSGFFYVVCFLIQCLMLINHWGGQKLWWSKHDKMELLKIVKEFIKFYWKPVNSNGIYILPCLELQGAWTFSDPCAEIIITGTRMTVKWVRMSHHQLLERHFTLVTTEVKEHMEKNKQQNLDCWRSLLSWNRVVQYSAWWLSWDSWCRAVFASVFSELYCLFFQGNMQEVDMLLVHHCSELITAEIGIAGVACWRGLGLLQLLSILSQLGLCRSVVVCSSEVLRVIFVMHLLPSYIRSEKKGSQMAPVQFKMEPCWAS